MYRAENTLGSSPLNRDFRLIRWYHLDDSPGEVKC